MALKTYKPSAPAFASWRSSIAAQLHKGKPVKALTVGKSEKGGRNNLGRITVRFRGGGHKQSYRLVDFKRRKLDQPAKVERLEYDPNRTAFIALIKYADGELSYILAPQRLSAGDEVVSGQSVDVKPGNAMPLASIPVGTIVHNVETEDRQGRRDRTLRWVLCADRRPRPGLCLAAPQFRRAAHRARPVLRERSARSRTRIT